MDLNQFADEVEAVLQELPVGIIRYLHNTEVIVQEACPNHNYVHDDKRRFADYKWLRGQPPDGSGSNMGVITLYRASYDGKFTHACKMREVIKQTLIHEIAHHLGLSEKDARIVESLSKESELCPNLRE